MARPFSFTWIEKPRLSASAWPAGPEELAWLRSQGIDIVLTLTEDPLPRHWVDEAGLMSVHIPIPDMEAPSNAQLTHALSVQERAKESNMGIHVHCLGGKGRTGTILAAMLVAQGQSAADAIRTVRDLRPGSIETPEQEHAVYDLGRRLRKGNGKDMPHHPQSRQSPLPFAPPRFYNCPSPPTVRLPGPLYMSSELMTRFLDGLRSSNLLDDDRIEEAMRSHNPNGDVDGLAEQLHQKGWLTAYQIEEIKEGRGERLIQAGYKILEKLPDNARGATYLAKPPNRREPVVLHIIPLSEFVAYGETVEELVRKAESAVEIRSPYLAAILNVQFGESAVLIAAEYYDAAELGYLVRDMGAIPTHLACTYTKQAAEALQVVHRRGLCHGQIDPRQFLLTPVTRKDVMNGSSARSVARPAAGATLRLDGLGIPQRDPGGGFYAPELAPDSFPDVASDIYSLGGCLYYLLTARTPNAKSPPARVEKLRSDVPPELADFVHRMMSAAPEDRPASTSEVIRVLGNYLDPASIATALASQGEPLVEEMEDHDHLHGGFQDYGDHGEERSEPSPRRRCEAGGG